MVNRDNPAGHLPRESRPPWVKVLQAFLGLAVVAGVVVGTFFWTSAPSVNDPTLGATSAPSPSKPQHVFVINLENTDFARAWGPTSKAPYLSNTLRADGLLLENYYAIYHSSLPNYIAQLSGQGPNPNTANDCAVYHPFESKSITDYGQETGKGCVYPDSVQTLAGQLTANGLTWKAYMEDMSTPCRHPVLGTIDKTKKARVGDQYATRHNPFMYFASITGSPDCASNVVDLTQLTDSLKSTATTANLSYITPNLCHDGHDNPCVDGAPGGLPAADAWLREWIPKITGSPAFHQDGILVITFDEGDMEGPVVGSVAPQEAAPTEASQGTGAPLTALFGPGGGRVGALLLSPFIKAGTTSQAVYNHYSLLGSIEDLFGLPYLGYAAVPDLEKFGSDVYNTK